ncbi:FAD-dependent oxidoreductase [Streptomyces qaidamensis]|uniref:FAD-dependent oxidoreductase n=1 Tax=Streptomyces qaidamensis TaxID=1783515 RepID=UPI00365C07A9
MTPVSTLQCPAPTVGIIGSGPSGCYTAQFLRKGLPGAQITVFESLPVPYGLVRYGVAADHQGTKSVSQQFDRLFERGQATFVGNVRIGRDVSFEAVARAFDVVVIATGMPQDRRLPVPQDAAARVIGAGRLLRALNGFPAGLGRHSAPLGRDVVVIGHGNVAVDVVRLLTKRSDELVGSDIDDHVLSLLRPRRLRSVRLMGRSSVENAKFDLAMLRELCQVDGVRIRVEGLRDSSRGVAVDLLRSHEEGRGAASMAEDGTDRTLVTIQFEAVPTRIRHANSMTSLEAMCGPSAEPRSYHADTIVTATGFCQDEEPCPGTPDTAWSGGHVYRVGWLGRGAQGNIAANRKHAQGVAGQIVADLAGGRIVAGRGPGLQEILPQLEKTPTSFSAWREIDRVERERAAAGRCRRKITDISEMVALAQQSMVSA